jgi:hypothetical protein
MNWGEDDPMYYHSDFQPYIIKRGEDIEVAIELNTWGEPIYRKMFATPELFEKYGFHLETTFELEEYISEDRRVVIRSNSGYGGKTKLWYVHVDNEDMDTSGTGEFDAMHELQHILKCNDIHYKFEL